MKSLHKLSESGEDFAAEYLKSNGYTIVARNYRYDRAETDIVCIKNNVLVFAEVKTRTNLSFGKPEESVGHAKQMQLVKSAEGFLAEHPEYEDFEKRIDVLAVFRDRVEMKISHIKNAFSL